MSEDKKMYDKFDKPVMQAMVYAKEASVDAGLDCLYPESLMIGILSTGMNDATVLIGKKTDLMRFRNIFKKELQKKKQDIDKTDTTKQENPNYMNLKRSRQFVEACKAANEISIARDKEVIDIVDVLFGILKVSKACLKIFEKNGLDYEYLEKRLSGGAELATTHAPDTKRKKGHKALNSFCTNLTEMARQNELDPIIAREKEIDQAITILCRRTKSNPVLLGEAGVGKTAIVEGMAQRIVAGLVPKQLEGYELYSLNLGSIVAGTKYRGQFEERMEELVKEIRASKSSILFIDEIHVLVGAGGASGGAMDASNILKPFLAKGELKCIGATTLKEFKIHFEKDGALTRRFQKVMVDEPDKQQMIKIMESVKARLESYHDCIITDDAVEASINLSGRYMPDKKFPDKTIDVLDMACAKYAAELSIDPSHIGQTVSAQCGIPIEVIMWDDNERIKKIEDTLSTRIIGQSHAINNVCRILKNSYSGVRNPSKPIGSFVFGGETGTGKTYMAKEMALAVFGKESSLIRLDMSEFSEQHSTSKLTGSPPGYVGFDDSEVFIDRVRRKPYCIVLLDEMDKAHPNVSRLFLQVMSDGVMTDTQGHVVNFKNVVLIMTGNFGMNEAEKHIGFDEESGENAFAVTQKRLAAKLKETYGAEFVNRVDEVIPFMPLGDAALKDIAKIESSELIERLAERGCKLKFADDAYDLIVQRSKSEHGQNATQIGRLIAKEVEPCISDALMEHGTGKYTISVKAKNDQFVSQVRHPRKTRAKSTA